MLKQIGNRPTMFFCIFFLLGLYVSVPLPFSMVISFVAILFCLAALIFAYDRLSAFWLRKNVIVLLPLIIGTALGLTFGSVYNIGYKDDILYLDGREGELTGVVEEVTYKSEYLSSFTVNTLSLDGKDKSFKVHIEVPYLLEADENDIIRINTVFVLPEEERIRLCCS